MIGRSSHLNDPVLGTRGIVRRRRGGLEDADVVPVGGPVLAMAQRL